MKCFYHTDMDGKCAGAIVYQYHEAILSGEYIPINYNQDFPFDTIQKDEQIIIVDFSLEKENDFERLLEVTKNIIWIDHHKTAIEKHRNIADKIPGIRQDGVAGCVLTWQFFYPNKSIPKVVELLGDYDIWAFKFGDNTKYLQTGIRLYDTEPKSAKWIDWLNPAYFPYEELKNGQITETYRSNYYKSIVKAWSFFAEFEGYKAICCNAGSASSQLFDSVKEDYDLMIPFIFDGKQWTVSLYTKKDIDCSEIAKKYGGGGHKKAAGFQCKELPFKKE